MSEKLSEMLKKATEWRDRLKKFKTESKYPGHIQEHIEILDYLIMQAEIVEKQLPVRPEVSE